jgi:hypothetical protein
LKSNSEFKVNIGACLHLFQPNRCRRSNFRWNTVENEVNAMLVHALACDSISVKLAYQAETPRPIVSATHLHGAALGSYW